MLLRTFSRREKLLMLLLAAIMLLGVYLLGVHYPVRDSLAQLETERANLDLELQIAMAQYSSYTAMQEELEELLSRPSDQVTVVPDYDNLQPLMNRLNQILSLAESYDLSFDPVTVEDSIVRRTIRMSFTCGSYQSARSIVEQLYRTGWRCLVSDLSLSTPQGAGNLADSTVVAAATVTYFEQSG